MHKQATVRTVNSVLKSAACEVLVLPITGEFDCERAFGRLQNPELRVDSDVPTGRVSCCPPAR
jgi:hypothetical protein